MVLGLNVDFRYPEGYPSIDDVHRYGIGWARCVSLPAMESWAGAYLRAGCRVLAVYTGESEQAGQYVMGSCSAVQIGNEPMMGHDAAWPAGGAQEMVDTWLRVKDIVWNLHGEWFPLVGPALWSQDYLKWRQLAQRLEGVTAAAVHVYPEPSGHTLEQVGNHLQRYRAVRSDLPLMATEWTSRWDKVLSVARMIDTYCTHRLWYTWNDPGQPHHALSGTPELGILSLAA